MIKETNKVIDLLKDTNNVEEQLMFLSLYNEFYNMFFSKNIDYYFEEKFDDSIDVTIRSLKLFPNDRKTFNAISLMDNFIKYFEYNTRDNFLGLKVVAVNTYKEKIREIAATKKHIDIIDRYDLSLEDKANIALTVDEYVRFNKAVCLDTYNEEFANSISESIYKNICDKLPELIEENKGLHDIELYNKLYRDLKYSTKDYLAEQYKNNGINFLGEINEFNTENIIPKYKESDKAIGNAFLIYTTACINAKDPKEKKEMKKDIAEIAETSTFGATKYAYKTVGKMGKSLIKAIFNK